MPVYINKDHQRMFYEEIGTGEVLLCIHPPGMGRKVFVNQYELSSTFRLIIPDLSGHGDSDTTKIAPAISDYSSELLDLLEHLQLKEVILFGYSAGGSIAQDFALTFPDRVKALILSGAFPKVAVKLLEVEFKAGMSWVKQDPGSLAKLLSFSHFKSPEIRAELEHHMSKSDPFVWYHFYNESLKYDCTDRLQEFKMPLLLLYGNRAKWIKYHVKYYQSCSDPSLVIVDGAFHQLPASHGPIVNQAIRDFYERTFTAIQKTHGLL
ncbi:alpha/beta fold hydrolase [Halobacillus sp. Marseille-Q1614]|uniref:alpha/beta fold hydrolase n=1 Tax=Halobacillus sp. Marseille-Q1614 TaxID=2709134 RepID=UPI0020C54385|nr:alpha/beta hydrolase [Halobacillus sp. Marseille-Q1614]